jgi:asparagine synthase (glutamine-hydrolysing)
LENAYATFRGIFTPREAVALTQHYSDLPPVDEAGWPTAPATDPREAISVLELTRYVRNQLLRDADVMGMASGVEIRTPFLDRPLVSSLWELPPSTRLEAGKRALAAAVPEIPPHAFSLPKRCFQFPFDRWLDGEWRDMFQAVEESSPVPLETWYRKWCVCSLGQAVRNLTEARHA